MIFTLSKCENCCLSLSALACGPSLCDKLSENMIWTPLCGDERHHQPPPPHKHHLLLFSSAPTRCRRDPSAPLPPHLCPQIFARRCGHRASPQRPPGPGPAGPCSFPSPQAAAAADWRRRHHAAALSVAALPSRYLGAGRGAG